MVVDGIWQLKQNGYINPSQIREYGKILCLSYKWAGSDKIRTIKYDIQNNCDKELVLKFMPILEQADEVVGHNSDRHDIPWVKTRLLYHGVSSISNIKSIDTLKVAKTLKFPSNKLDEIAKYLGLKTRKVKTRGEEMWQDVSRNKCKKALNEMANYCEGDVFLLEEVFNKLEGFAKPKTHIGINSGSSDRCDCPYCGEHKTHKNKTIYSASGDQKHELKCTYCKKYFYVTNKAYSFRLKKKAHKQGKIQ